MLDNDKAEETHHLLPSGEWEGFYCYNHTPEQHRMAIELTFSEGEISGSGVDDVAPFTWKGKYNLETMKLDMTKSYASHNVFYRGDIDENGIWGTWELAQDFSQFPAHMVDFFKQAVKHMLMGGFHIWPKKGEQEAEEEAVKEKVSSAKLQEIFIEEFS